MHCQCFFNSWVYVRALLSRVERMVIVQRNYFNYPSTVQKALYNSAVLYLPVLMSLSNRSQLMHVNSKRTIIAEDIRY